ncbi:MAG: sigma factor [Planctomycetota bacterium]
MKTNGTRADVDQYAANLIRIKARQLVCAGRFLESERKDLEQEMTLHLIARRPKFDKARASERTFVSRIVDRKISNLVRRQILKSRVLGQRICSLNESISDGEGGSVERAETLATVGPDRRLGKDLRAKTYAQDLAIDLAQIVARLPEQLRRLCEVLKEDDPAGAARKMGIPRSTLDSHIGRLRRRFEDAGLRDYFQSVSLFRRSQG